MAKQKAPWPRCTACAESGHDRVVVRLEGVSPFVPDPSGLCAHHLAVRDAGVAGAVEVGAVDEAVAETETAAVPSSGGKIADLRSRLVEDLSREDAYLRIVGSLLATLDAERETRVRCRHCGEMTAAAVPDSSARVAAARELLSQVVPKLPTQEPVRDLSLVAPEDMSREERAELLGEARGLLERLKDPKALRGFLETEAENGEEEGSSGV